MAAFRGPEANQLRRHQLGQHPRSAGPWEHSPLHAGPGAPTHQSLATCHSPTSSSQTRPGRWPGGAPGGVRGGEPGRGRLRRRTRNGAESGLEEAGLEERERGRNGNQKPREGLPRAHPPLALEAPSGRLRPGAPLAPWPLPSSLPTRHGPHRPGPQGQPVLEIGDFVGVWDGAKEHQKSL